MLICYPLPLHFQTLIPKTYSENPQTLGEHIKRVRLMRGLRQRDVAALVDANPYTVINWEKGRTEPPVPSIPAIISFLGYDPFPPPQTLSERMLAKRRAMGWSIAEAARRLGVDEGTWGYWEKGSVVLWPRYRDLLESLLVAA